MRGLGAHPPPVSQCPSRTVAPHPQASAGRRSARWRNSANAQSAAITETITAAHMISKGLNSRNEKPAHAAPMPASPAFARIGASNGAQHTAHATPSPIHVNQNFFI